MLRQIVRHATMMKKRACGFDTVLPLRSSDVKKLAPLRDYSLPGDPNCFPLAQSLILENERRRTALKKAGEHTHLTVKSNDKWFKTVFVWKVCKIILCRLCLLDISLLLLLSHQPERY